MKEHVRKLLISGSITTDPYCILAEQKSFYSNLYKSEVTNSKASEEFLKSLNIHQLSDEQKITCEGQITSEECKKILETFQNYKSPGNDGIPIEFYKSYWDLICESFMNCVRQYFEKG